MSGIFRTQRQTGLALALVAALSAAGAVAIVAVFGAHGAVPRTGPLTVHGGLERPPGSFVRGNGLYDGRGGRAQLGGDASGALIGPLSPVAVRSADGTLVVYNTWADLRTVDRGKSFSQQGIADGEALGTPSLRVHDGAGHDYLVAKGAYSAAWRDDGAIAFVKGVDSHFRAGRAYEGQVVVREGVHGRETPWTDDAAHYVVYGWAGDRLLFYRVGFGEKLELLVADRPGSIRPLADGSAIAISPDAARVAVVSQDGTNVRILNVASGRELSWIDLTTATPPLRWVAYSGSWVGDHLVAPASPGLAVFHVGTDSIELEQVLGLDRTTFPAGVQEPRFVDDEGNEIAAVADVPPTNADGGVSMLLQCDRIARTCERGESAPSKDWLRLVAPTRKADEGGR
jgi:hypothetical protein